MKMIQVSIILLLSLQATYATPQAETGLYAIVTVKMGTHSYDAIRWNRTTGKAYLLRNQAWRPIPETDSDTPLPEGTYEAPFIPLRNDWRAIRINTQNGECWNMSDGRWAGIQPEPAHSLTD